MSENYIFNVDKQTSRLLRNHDDGDDECFRADSPYGFALIVPVNGAAAANNRFKYNQNHNTNQTNNNKQVGHNPLR